MCSSSLQGEVWYSKLQSEVLLAELFLQLNAFPENEKTKLAVSFLSNSYSDVITSGFQNSSDLNLIANVQLLDTLVRNSPRQIVEELCNLFHDDFLVLSVQPALIEGHGGKSIADATAGFRIVCEHLLHPRLQRKLIQFTMDSLLDALVCRLKIQNQDALSSTLGLFKALLELYSEDLWHELILQYLMPMKHVLVSERQKSIPDIEFQQSNGKFMDCIPSHFLDILPPETVADNFALYIQQELERIRIQDQRFNGTLVLNKSEEPINALFHSWCFKYDGTDVLHALRRNENTDEAQIHEEDEFNIFSTSVEKESNDSVAGAGEDDSDDDNHNPESTTTTSPEGPEETPTSTSPFQGRTREDQGYFGPFLDSVFNLLDNWTALDPEVILMLSEVISLLASSRIPLISSALLDFSIVLQPCFPSFHSIIHSVRLKLDGTVRNYPEHFIMQTWRKACSSLNLESYMNEESPRAGNLGRVLKSKILQSSAFSFFSQKSKTTSVALSKMLGEENDSRVAYDPANWFSSLEEEAEARKMVIRCIIFVHWILELAAVAQQSCWYSTRQNQRKDE